MTDETSLMEICRPRVFGLFTSTFAGSQVCWLIFWWWDAEMLKLEHVVGLAVYNIGTAETRVLGSRCPMFRPFD